MNIMINELLHTLSIIHRILNRMLQQGAKDAILNRPLPLPQHTHQRPVIVMPPLSVIKDGIKNGGSNTVNILSSRSSKENAAALMKFSRIPSTKTSTTKMSDDHLNQVNDEINNNPSSPRFQNQHNSKKKKHNSDKTHRLGHGSRKADANVHDGTAVTPLPKDEGHHYGSQDHFTSSKPFTPTPIASTNTPRMTGKAHNSHANSNHPNHNHSSIPSSSIHHLQHTHGHGHKSLAVHFARDHHNHQKSKKLKGGGGKREERGERGTERAGERTREHKSNNKSTGNLQKISNRYGNLGGQENSRPVVDVVEEKIIDIPTLYKGDKRKDGRRPKHEQRKVALAHQMAYS